MMKDPVCGAQVDEKSASATSNYQGRMYAFCGSDCKEKFDKNPQQYAQSGEGSKSSRQPEHARR
jgi:YHS domain-containing protein